MSPPKARKRPGGRKRASGGEIVVLSYDLAELPTTQHRAGLAGLVMMLQWLDSQPGIERSGTCRLEDVSARGARIVFDGPGLQWLFDWLYAADEEEREETKPRKGKNKQIIPPIREELREVRGRGGKPKQKTIYVYPAIVPKGAMLLAFDPTRQGNQGLWVKLWRDFVWTTLRGVPAQRKPFEARAQNRAAKDGLEFHLALVHAPDASVPLPSTYYLGAQARTAEGVSFRDQARWQLLLHLWPYVGQIYVPRVLDLKDDKMTFDGFAVAIPDVARLDDFTDELRDYLAHRSAEPLSYLPRGAVIDLPVEAALDTAARLRAQLSARAASFEGLVSAYELFHVRKDGNNVRVLYSGRIDPTDVLDRYQAVRASYRDPLFLRRRITNLLESQRLSHISDTSNGAAAVRWYSGFDRDAATAPYRKAFFGSNIFRNDARRAFSIEPETEETLEHETKAARSIETLVFRLVREYVHRRVKSKYGLAWEKAKSSPSLRRAYNEAREKIARDAFLAVRSRTGADFAEYFAGTIGSVPHRLHESDFVELAKHLRDDRHRADIRTLTLLALSAAAWAPSTDNKNEDSQGEAK